MVTPEGILSLPLDYLKSTIAASARFRSVTNSSTVAAAKTHIFKGRAKATASKPRAIIRHLTEEDFERISNTGWLGRGQLIMAFEFPIGYDKLDNFEDAYTQFTNDVGTILEDMVAATITDPSSYLNITNLQTTTIGQADPKEHTNEQFWISEHLVHYQ